MSLAYEKPIARVFGGARVRYSHVFFNVSQTYDFVCLFLHGALGAAGGPVLASQRSPTLS